MRTTFCHGWSSEQLEYGFHSTKWDRMSAEQRLELCQEIVDRECQARGMERVPVTATDQRGNLMGQYIPHSGQMEVNIHILERGETVDAKGNATALPGSNAEVRDTLAHELSHAYDAQLNQAVEQMQIGGEYNKEIIQDAEAQGLDINSIRSADSIYIDYETSPDVYRVQLSEQRAFDRGGNAAKQSFEISQAKLGPDAGYKAYLERQELDNGYQTSLENLQAITGDQNFDKTLQEQMNNLYYQDNKQDDQFTYGDPSSRSVAQSLVQNTPGGQYAQLLAQNGIQGAERYTSGNVDQSSSGSGAQNTGNSVIGSGAQSAAVEDSSGGMVNSSDTASPGTAGTAAEDDDGDNSADAAQDDDSDADGLC